MHALLLRLAGPMQSWGTQSRFSERDSGAEPSKSGVLGLVCAALGRGREEPLDDLAALRLGVRVDREGRPEVDYQTAQTTPQAHTNALLSHRAYLADAAYLVGLEGAELSLLRTIHAALQAPRWQLFLGRKGYVPSLPVWLPDGLRTDASLEEELRQYPWPVPPARLPPAGRPDPLRLVLETPRSRVGGDVRRDQPLGAAFATRTFGLRAVETTFFSPVSGSLKEPHDVPVSPATESAL